MLLEKSTLRKTMRDRLAGLTPASRSAASEAVAGRIGELPAWQAARVIGLFAGRGDEMETERLWPCAGAKKICYPVVEGADLRFRAVTALADLSRGSWGVLEPTSLVEETPDFLLVPGLAFDATGARLGRGRGFYDRWLAQHPATARWGVCFDFQRVPEVPVDAQDVRMDGVITESGFFPAR